MIERDRQRSRSYAILRLHITSVQHHRRRAPMSQLRVFLSHSSQDKAAADQFASAFRQAGADVWYDEESLGAGHLRRTIMKELGDRPIFVVLLSPVALASSWV